jgi:hypothetical protein
VIALIPKWAGSKPTKHFEKFRLTLEASARIGRWEPENTGEIIMLKIEASKVADPASSRFNMGPKFQKERIARHKFDPTLRVRPKVASEYYKCQGIGHRAFCQGMSCTAKTARENEKLTREGKPKRPRKSARSQVEL